MAISTCWSGALNSLAVRRHLPLQVNVASRMESTGKPGEIQVSNDYRQLLGEWFNLEDRGLVAVKGKGDMHTWMLKVRGACLHMSTA